MNICLSSRTEKTAIAALDKALSDLNAQGRLDALEEVLPALNAQLTALAARLDALEALKAETDAKDDALAQEIAGLREELKEYGKDSKLSVVFVIAVVSLAANVYLALSVRSMKRKGPSDPDGEDGAYGEDSEDEAEDGSEE